MKNSWISKKFDSRTMNRNVQSEKLSQSYELDQLHKLCNIPSLGFPATDRQRKNLKILVPGTLIWSFRYNLLQVIPYRHQYETPISWVSIKTNILGRFEWFIITRAVQFQVLKWTVVNHGSILLILFLTETLARGDSLLIASGFSVGFAVP